jgi:hypothetical protein
LVVPVYQLVVGSAKRGFFWSRSNTAAFKEDTEVVWSNQYAPAHTNAGEFTALDESANRPVRDPESLGTFFNTK